VPISKQFRRDSAHKRGYNRTWQKQSKVFLSQAKWCRKCMADDKYNIATVVDHIIPHRRNKELFWDKTNWQALCKRCHDQKTATGQ